MKRLMIARNVIIYSIAVILFYYAMTLLKINHFLMYLFRLFFSFIDGYLYTFSD